MISIIIPCYNSIEYITDALSSAINQNVSREIIIVDDASTDGTIKEIVRFLETGYNAVDIPKAKLQTRIGSEGHKGDKDKVKGRLRKNRFDNVNLVYAAHIELTNSDMQSKITDAEQLVNEGDLGKSEQSNVFPCNIYMIKNRRNRGPAYSRNKGVRVSRGKYVAFLDADDYWREDKLKKQLALIEKSGSFLCTTDRELVINNKPSGAVVKSPAYITFRRLRRSNWINCSAVLVRRNALARFPMEQGFIHEDYLCWLNIVREYGAAVNVSEPLLLYRVRIKSKSGNKFRSLKLSFNTYREFGYGFAKSLGCVAENAFMGVVKFSKSVLASKKRMYEGYTKNY